MERSIAEISRVAGFSRWGGVRFRTLDNYENLKMRWIYLCDRMGKEKRKRH